ncbi:lipopolysaccharide export system protein LptA [Geobacter sp. OR-1]|uniref:lipopolysaccharide transport periplasmic protein LptA n=1 Tax=Geobacter sp. OR-1 TaxID=1266765 RepID=UPI000542D374|nr:lipopolysaccharide transport periplasmic protein LptA [Geobacter sp. OR-1]GAM08793.1 lipopolysaccharide export system protein LptA [Geobacter sp. OR-1]
MRYFSALLASLLLTVVIVPSVLSTPVPPGVRSDQPIQIKSNELSSDGNGKVAVFSGSVVARQGDVTIYCDLLRVHYGAKERDIAKVEAVGNVRIVQGNRQGLAGRALFDNQAGTIILEENPRVSQGNDTITGKVITFYLNEQKSVVTGGAGQRVEAVISPKGTGINVGSKP